MATTPRSLKRSNANISHILVLEGFLKRHGIPNLNHPPCWYDTVNSQREIKSQQTVLDSILSFLEDQDAFCETLHHHGKFAKHLRRRLAEPQSVGQMEHG